MNTQSIIEKLQNNENVDKEELIKAFQRIETQSNSDRVSKYGKNHNCKTYLTPETLHKQLAKHIQSQGYKSQKDFSYHMAETFEALFDSLEKVSSLDPSYIVEAVEYYQSVEKEELVDKEESVEE